MKDFNTTGTCIPNKHYMVDTTNKLNQIIKLIEKEEYFTINRSRQYGKTTTMYLLKTMLKSKYEIINISLKVLEKNLLTQMLISQKILLI